MLGEAAFCIGDKVTVVAPQLCVRAGHVAGKSGPVLGPEVALIALETLYFGRVLFSAL